MTKNEALQEVAALSKGITHDAAQLLELLGTGAMQLPIGDTNQYVVVGTLATIASVLGSAVSTAAGEPVATDDLPTLPEPYGGMLRLAGGIEPVYTADQMREYARAAIAARLAAPTQVSAPQASAAQEVRAVPEGWKLVPLMPTMEMQDAPELEIGGCYSCSPTRPNWGECAEIYNAMIAAAPEAPTSASTAPAAMDEKGGAV